MTCAGGGTRGGGGQGRCQAGCDRGMNRFGEKGKRKKEALRAITSSCPELLQLLKILHALGYDFHRKNACQIDDGGYDRRNLRVSMNGGHEGAVDLQSLHGEPTKGTERGIAGAEIIDAKGDAEGGELRHQLYGALWILHGGALGDLELQTLRANTSRVESLPNLVDKPRIGKLPGAHVDTDIGGRRGARSVPGDCLAA